MYLIFFPYDAHVAGIVLAGLVLVRYAGPWWRHGATVKRLDRLVAQDRAKEWRV